MSDFSSSNQKIAKNTILLYIRQLFTLTLALFTSRLTLQVLGVSDFGIYAAVGGITAFLSIFTTSLSSSSQRFLTYALGQNDYERLNKTYIMSLSIHILICVCLAVLAESIGLWFLFNKMQIPEDRFNIAIWVYQFSILGAVFNILNAPNNAEIISHEDMGVFALFSIIDAILRFSGVILLFYIDFDKLLSYAALLFLCQVLNQIAAFFYCRFKYSECRIRYIFDKELFKSMVSLAGWNMLNNLAVMGFIQGTNILLNMFFGPILNSAYTVASQAYSGIRSFTSSFQLASNPQIVKLYSQSELDEMHKLLMRVCKFSFYLIFALSFPFVVNANAILTLWLGVVPEHTQEFFILLLIFSYIDVMAYPLDVAAQATGNLRKYSICVSSCVISILPLSYICFKMGSVPESIMIVAIIVALMGVTLRLNLLSKLIEMPSSSFMKEVFPRPLLSTILIVGLSYPLGLMFSNGTLITSLLYFILICIIEVIVIYFVGLTKTEKSIVNSMFCKVINKLR